MKLVSALFGPLTVLALAVSGMLCPRTAGAADSEDLARRDAIVVRAVERIPGYDYGADPKVREAVLRHIARAQGTPEFVSLVKRFQPPGIEPKLAEMLTGADRSAAVEAADMLLSMDEGRRTVRKLLSQESSNTDVPGVIEILGLLGNGRANHFLAEIASDPERPYAQRRPAVAGLARSKAGQQRVIELAKNSELVGDTLLVAATLLSRSEDQGIRSQAAEVLPELPKIASESLPPIDEMAKLTGDAEAGMQLFRGKATCANCHIVDQFGKDVGPNLSEIGDKLSREAMLTAILAPSAGISHNYENYVVLTEEGQVVTGLKVSETEDEIVIRTAEAIDRKFPLDELVEIKKSEKSIMPEDLQQLTGQKGLIDIVEYMTTLKKKG
ncbi:c-type cytochrome [Roseiconus nitratireducens]|uniref:C-type cytochrome n=1 Tax=Roseiconus nitratireducens TaxID=2605748 RepID=A0A5M6DF79_9BACT|nr:c-type cytochrome [Roseiconus nitratireducens]KAA5546197.1 c-type cytochrome [Roseiconus nitratireducens]